MNNAIFSSTNVYFHHSMQRNETKSRRENNLPKQLNLLHFLISSHRFCFHIFFIFFFCVGTRAEGLLYTRRDPRRGHLSGLLCTSAFMDGKKLSGLIYGPNYWGELFVRQSLNRKISYGQNTRISGAIKFPKQEI